MSLVGVPPATKLLLLEPVKFPLVLLKVNGASPMNSEVDAAGSFQSFLSKNKDDNRFLRAGGTTLL